jgi:hypothetical protein
LLDSIKPILPYLAYGLGGTLAGWGIYDLLMKKKHKELLPYIKLLLGSAIAAAPLLLSQTNISKS